MDASSGTALVSYVGYDLSTDDQVVFGRRINADGTWMDAAPVALATADGWVMAILTAHSADTYYVSFAVLSYPDVAWTTLAIPPTSATLRPVVEAAGRAVPYGAPVASTLPALAPIGAATSYVPAIANANTLSAIAAAPDAFLVAGTSAYVSLTPEAAGSSACVRLGLGGMSLGSSDCNLFVSGISAFSDDSASGQPVPPQPNWVSPVSGMLLYVTAETAPVVQRFDESTGDNLSALTFPPPVTPLAGVSSLSQPLVQGGVAQALAAYAGTFATTPNGSNFYARWITPGLVGGAACASDDDCASLSCVGGLCTTPAAAPDGGTDASSTTGGGDAGDAGDVGNSGEAGPGDSGSGGSDANESLDGGAGGLEASTASDAGHGKGDGGTSGSDAIDAGQSSEGSGGSSSGCGCAIPGAAPASGRALWLVPLAALAFAAPRRRGGWRRKAPAKRTRHPACARWRHSVL
jgi:hypothetical protein